MKKLIPFLMLIAACSDSHEPKSSATVNLPIPAEKETRGDGHFAWHGSINDRIPIFLHYSIKDKLVLGEITYLNTKARKPIKLIGTIEDDKSLRILEFESSGNISGIITGNHADSLFSGNWFSPKTRNEFVLSLALKDTAISPVQPTPANNDVVGDYHYQYSEEGYVGDLEIKKVDKNKIAFSVFSVTGAPGRNIAEVPMDTVVMTGDHFRYKIPGSDSCEFNVKFFKEFAVVEYTRGYCNGEFGLNATIDGIFLKLPAK